MHKAVKAGEQNAMQMLVKLFDWLDGLEPQGTAEIIARSQKREVKTTNTPSPVNQGVPKEVNDSAVSCSHGTRFLFFSFLLKIACEPMVASKFFQTPIVTEGKEVWVAQTNEVALKDPQEVLEGVRKVRRVFVVASKQGAFAALCLYTMLLAFVFAASTSCFPAMKVTTFAEWCVILYTLLCPHNVVAMDLNRIFFTLTLCFSQGLPADCIKARFDQSHVGDRLSTRVPNIPIKCVHIFHYSIRHPTDAM